jgi:CheY-like chemotaxis protein
MLASATVLVVENDSVTRELLDGVLRTAGCQVLAVPTGNAGLLSLCQHRAHIDWLVTRVNLPGLVDGWLLANEYHQHNPERPVILLSEVISEAECPSIDALFVLSITHKPHAEGGAQSDIGEAREAAPHDHVAGRRILGAGEITAEPGDLGQIVCQR